MKKAIKDHAKDFLAIVGLVLISGFVAVYILNQQRFSFPVFSEQPFELRAELENAQAVTPGQGQGVEVAGVKIGRIGGVSLKDGRAIVRLDIFRRYKDLVKTDARGLLRPRTGLKDMFLQLDPGSADAPVAEEGFTIPVERTLTDVDLDEVLAELDTDTRDHLQLLLDGAARGLEDRGEDLAELFRRFGPTARDLRRVNQAVAQEREALKDAIRGLALLTEELAGKDDDLAELVDSSAAVFRAFAAEDRNVSGTVARLPGALRQASSTLSDVERFATELGPAAERLVPTVRALDEANREVRPVARALVAPLRDEIRPFAREAQPLVRELRPASTGLARAFPDLTTTLQRLNNLFNMLGFNPNGREAPDKADRQEGYLFWYAWVTHQTANLINIDDGNGPLRPVFLTGTCSTITTLIEDEPAFEFLLNLTPIVTEQCQNPETRSVQPEKVKRQLAREAAARKKREARR